MIIKPIFIVGPGRSGTTLLSLLISLHPELAWFSSWTNRFPNWPEFSLLSRFNDLTFLEKATRGIKKLPRPAEAYGIWNYCFPGFSEANIDWDENQVNKNGAAKLTRLIESHLRWHGKKRFSTKYTGWPRIRFLRAIFPDALFVYIDRDPRAVAFSYMKHKWHFKKKPHVLEAMSMKERLDIYAGWFLRYYQAKKQFELDRDYIQISYERLIRDPSATLQEICEKTALKFDSIFQRRIATWSLEKDTNQSWRQALLPEDQTYLTALLEQPLREMGYEVRSGSDDAQLPFPELTNTAILQKKSEKG
jgi:Sulfotransferase family